MKLIIKEYECESAKFLSENCVDELTLFVWDGCHKIYLVENMDDIKSVKQNWGENTIFYNIDELPEIWYSSCSLRFIQNWSLTKNYIRQFNEADFKFID